MGDIQIIFVVESNSTCKSDWIYIKDTIEQFYQYDRAHVKLSVIYMDGKGKYSNKEKAIASQIKTYQNAVKNGASRRSVVIYCFDCDEYDTNQEDLVFLDKAEQYCAYHVFGSGVINPKVSGVHDQIQPEKKKPVPLLSANLYTGKCQQPSGKDKQ